MVLDKLGDSLQSAIKKIAGGGRVDKHAVDEMIKEIQRALLQSDVNVKQVMELSKRIRERALDEKPPGGMGAREHVIRIDVKIIDTAGRHSLEHDLIAQMEAIHAITAQRRRPFFRRMQDVQRT